MDPRPDDETLNPTEATASGGAPAPDAPTAASAAPEGGSPTMSGEGSGAPMAAALASQPPAAKAGEPRKGGRLKGKIVKVGEESAFVDFGGREEAILDLKEIQDAEGNLTKNIGDEVHGVVLDVEGGVRLSLRGGTTGGGGAGRSGPPINTAALMEAASSGVPVEGKVTGVNKGGLVVQILGARAFCPFSQIDRHWVEDPTVFVGQKLMFRVSTADPKGRNVVVSRRALLEQDTKAKAETLRTQISVGQVVKGVVVRLRPFGAFVDIGGIDGLIHVSEISHSRVKDPSDLLKVGQEVEVKIRSIENLGRSDERIGLSLKDLQADPWTAVAGALKPGAVVHGKVVRLADFGAFLEIGPGVDGLAHVSTLADRRVGHPSEVLEVGQELDVWVVSIDPSNRRVSLSVMDPATRGERQGSGRPPREGGGEGGGWSGSAEPWNEPAPSREGGRRDRGRREGGGGGRREGARREGGRKEREGGGRRDRDWADDHDRGFRDSGMTSMQEAFERMRERN